MIFYFLNNLVDAIKLQGNIFLEIIFDGIFKGHIFYLQRKIVN